MILNFQTSAAVEEAKSMLVPKLRFPEFQDSDDWNQENMSSVATVVMGSSPKSECYNDIQNGLPLLQGNADIRNRLSAPRVFTSEITKECQIGDILMSVRAPVGSVAKSIHHACIGRGIAAIHAKHPNSQEFLYQWLLSYEPRWANISQGGTFDAINRDDLTQVDLTSPKPTEQQKIAECLSSVDELMAAQARKVDALKTHKKGLMQQLFPREGETQPRLRFPEFQNAGEWEVQRLDELAYYENGKAHENDISEYGRYIVVNSKFISTEGEVRKFSNEGFCVADEGDVLMVLSDVSNGRAIAKCYFVESDDLYTVNQRICRIQPTKVNGRLLFYVLDRNSYFLDFDDGIKQTNLRKEDVVGFPLCVPPQPDEQHRIATCLSSLDALFTAETQKHEDLKTHKKGLMQQLFPSLDEVDP